MVRKGRTFDPALAARWPWLAAVPFAHAGDDALERPIAAAAPLEIPHTPNLVLAEKARRRNRKPDNIESHQFLDLDAGPAPGGVAQGQRHARAHPHARAASARRWWAGSPRTCTAARKTTAGVSRSIRAKANTSSSTAST